MRGSTSGTILLIFVAVLSMYALYSIYQMSLAPSPPSGPTATPTSISGPTLMPTEVPTEVLVVTSTPTPIVTPEPTLQPHEPPTNTIVGENGTYTYASAAGGRCYSSVQCLPKFGKCVSTYDDATPADLLGPGTSCQCISTSDGSRCRASVKVDDKWVSAYSAQ